ncbi:hypothetical protein E8F20_06835 [Pseudomonas sp. BN415]|uniref:DUF5676 family membrane protein n=1 Tax=Pseudomonas sp. BN415 TaxID=2567889 RepID=UPI00245459D7|nr:DUF5676 family membrane protein [Pseudomonas sp. BN415]MDH4581588.1 hypothetical protein [Pseudomonas sp. BN415]
MIVPWKTGVALALTMAASYTVCAVLYALWPAQGIAFLNALFHGLDFNGLQTSQTYTVATFVGPLLVLTLWGLLVGTLFAWLYRKLHGSSR